MFLTALLLLAGCQRTAGKGVALRDDLGRSVLVPRQIGRVVTLAPSLTEMVFSVGSGKLVVATDDFSDEPSAARMLSKVGGMQPSVELIVRARPDLVIATTNGNHLSLLGPLTSAGVPLFVVASERLTQIPQAMNTLGGVLGSPRRVKAVASLRSAIASEHRVRSRRPRVLFLLWTGPLYVAGRETFVDDLIELCGGVNAVPVTMRGWPQYSLEALVADPPDLLLYPAASVSPAQVGEILAHVPNWNKEHRAVAVDENRFTRPGPRVGEAAAELNAILDHWEGRR